jgi:hypothetical protein
MSALVQGKRGDVTDSSRFSPRFVTVAAAEAAPNPARVVLDACDWPAAVI